MIVSDNGPPFNSIEFVTFCKANGISTLKSPPYHPQSNGLAERQVQNVKSALNKFLLQKSSLTLEQQIVNFLFTYRNTPTSSGLSPNEVIFRVKPKTRLDWLKPSKERVVSQEDLFKYNVIPHFSTGEKVLVGKLGPHSDKWKIGFVVERISAVTYLVNVENRSIFKHVNHIKKFNVEDE